MEWIVLANQTGAKIYRYTREGQFHLLETYDNPLGREKNEAMTTDQPGLSRAKFMSAAPHSLSKEKSSQEILTEQFATHLSKTLKSKLEEDRSLNLKIVAEPKLMGKIKGHFDEHRINERLSWEAKDLLHVPQDKWAKILALN